MTSRNVIETIGVGIVRFVGQYEKKEQIFGRISFFAEICSKNSTLLVSVKFVVKKLFAKLEKIYGL